MKQIGHKVFSIIFCLTLVSCNQTEIYNQRAKTLDSLSGVLNVSVARIEQTDTVLLSKAIGRFENYRSFIQNNIKDTLTKPEADALQVFYKSGKNLAAFRLNRTEILNRSALVNSQIEKLRLAIKNQEEDLVLLNQYLSQEQKQITNLVNAIYAQQTIYFSGLQEFKTSLRAIEQLIKLRNNNQLPDIVKEEEVF